MLISLLCYLRRNCLAFLKPKSSALPQLLATLGFLWEEEEGDCDRWMIFVAMLLDLFLAIGWGEATDSVCQHLNP